MVQDNKKLSDIESEKILLASIIKGSESMFYDVDAIVKDIDLYLPANKLIYMSIGKLYSAKAKITIGNILSICKDIDPKAIQLYSLTDYLSILSEHKAASKDISFLARKIAKLSLMRQLRDRLNEAADKLSDLPVDRPLSEILASAEEPIFKFTTNLISDDQLIEMGSYTSAYLEHVVKNRPEFFGIPTGFPIYDHLIGGGLYIPGVHLIGGRSKQGKSFFGTNVAANVIGGLDCKVLYLDTELSAEIIADRVLAKVSKVPIDKIKNGSYSDDPKLKKQVDSVIPVITGKFYYKNIAGSDHNEWISHARRWLMKEVGFDQNGNVNPCLIILDYIKTMNIFGMKNFSEYQYLGQVITDLANFCGKYKIAILAFTQLNRDGITKEDQSVIAGSDRLIHLCASCSMFKKKSAEDFADDPKVNGDRKLIILATRFGPGLEDGEYINLKTDLSRGLIEEGPTNLQNRIERNKNEIKSKGKLVETVDNLLIDDDYDSSDDEKIEF